MSQNQIQSKPASVEEPREEGLDETPCSASFGTMQDAYLRIIAAPWKQATRGPNGCPIIGNAKGTMVCMLAHSANHSDQQEEAETNARLIEAAPRMLKALQSIAGYDPNIMSGYECKEIAAEALKSILPNTESSDRAKEMKTIRCPKCKGLGGYPKCGECQNRLVVNETPSSGEKQWVPAPFARKLARELEQARAYADTLAAGLPVGMLPKDVENLRDANAHFAQQVFGFEKEMSEAWHILSVLSANMLDDGPTWPRALEWLDRNEKFRPTNELVENLPDKQK